MQCVRAFAIFTRIDFPPFPIFYRNRGKEGVDCEQSEQDGVVVIFIFYGDWRRRTQLPPPRALMLARVLLLS